MRHHFGDSLDRSGRYWTIVANKERYAYRIADVPAGSKDVTIVTVGKDDEHWRRTASFPNLEELTLHEPSREQIAGLPEMPTVRRLRVTHARPKSLKFVVQLPNVEELVLEYVSGVDDLSPLGELPNLRSVHLENLRRVGDFSGMGKCKALQYLAIHGTLDWKQPIEHFEFLRELTNLEVLNLWQVKTKAAYPATLPVTRLGKLKKLALRGSYLDVREYALMEEGLPGVEGAQWGPFAVETYQYAKLPPDDVRSRLPKESLQKNHPEVTILFDGRREVPDPEHQWFVFTGKSAGRAKCGSKGAAQKCQERAAMYAEFRRQARALLDA